MAGDPVAWRAIERGWKVFAADGTAVGYVDQITGDLNADIFDGITVGDGGTVLTRSRYVPAERVAAIRVGEVELDLGPDEVASLPPYRELISEPLASLIPEEEKDPRTGAPPEIQMRPAGGGLGELLSSLFRRRRTRES